VPNCFLKKAPLSDVVVQRHSSARCVVAGRHGWARIQTFPKTCRSRIPSLLTAIRGQDLEPYGSGYIGHSTISFSRARGRPSPGVGGLRLALRAPASGHAGQDVDHGRGKAEKGIWGRCFHRSRREICWHWQR
jgi:hypothetical protein